MAIVKRSEWPTLGGSLLTDFFDDERFFNSPWLRGQNLPAVNIKENDKNFEVEMAAPGFDKKDIQIALDEGLLTISAEKKEENEKKEDRYTRREFGYTHFSRSFNVPGSVTEDDIQASYENGVLRLMINKKPEPESKPRRSIEIK
jgi:HSP20 family protein